MGYGEVLLEASSEDLSVLGISPTVDGDFLILSSKDSQRLRDRMQQLLGNPKRSREYYRSDLFTGRFQVVLTPLDKSTREGFERKFEFDVEFDVRVYAPRLFRDLDLAKDPYIDVLYSDSYRKYIRLKPPRGKE
jgi:hypothetical protein